MMTLITVLLGMLVVASKTERVEATATIYIRRARFYIFETMKQRRANATTHKKLSSQNKQIIDTMVETEKTTKPTLQAIANTYKSKTSLQTEKKDLLQKISKTEKTDIIKSATANIQDQPTRT